MMIVMNDSNDDNSNDADSDDGSDTSDDVTTSRYLNHVDACP